MRNFTVKIDGKAYDCEVEETSSVKAERNKVRSPMEGRVLSVEKKQGERVKAGECIMVLEAVKTQEEILAPCDGKIAVMVPEGETVGKDDFLVMVTG